MTTKQDGQVDMPAAVTRSLLGWGVVAGPFYLIVGLAQALTRDGFDLSTHPLSLLMLGDYGWIQTVNLVLSGLMVMAAALGFARAMRPASQAPWAEGLIGVYGLGLIVSAIFPPDPMAGFPAGSSTSEMTTSGAIHLMAGGLGFIALATAAIVVSGWFRDRDDDGVKLYGYTSSGLILLGFIGGAALANEPVGVLLLWVSVVAGLAWLTITSVTMYRIVPHPDRSIVD